jgi:hypothetical protein
VTLKFTLPGSYDFHERIHSLIVHGNIKKVADEVHKHRSQLSRELNPDEPTDCALYEACLELAAWRKVQPEIFEVQAETLTDLIVSLRGSGQTGAADDDAELKRLCDGMTTALLTRDEGEIRSAMFKLHGFLDSRVRRPMSAAERCREVRLAG